MSGRLLALDVAAEGDETAVCIYDSPLPAFIDSELERLYGNVFASVVRLRCEGRLQQVSAWVVRRGGRVSAVMLFRRDGQTVEALNDTVALAQDDIADFVRTMFDSYAAVGVVSFAAVQCRLARFPFPWQQFNCSEDIVLALPASVDAWFGALGKNMRSSIRRYQKKLQAEVPGFSWTVLEGQQASEQLVAEIVALSSARLASKNQASSHTGESTARLARLVRARGVVLVASANGRVCGGVICSHYGGNFFMHVVAHDPAYDDYRLGKVCCYLSVCDAIGRGGREYHFLWGKYEYKYRLLGVQRDLDRLVVYRSRLSLLLNGGTWLHTAWRGYGRRGKRWLREGQGRVPRLLRAAWNRCGV